MKARVFVTLKTGVLDPQGKVIDLELAESDATKARASLKEMCEKLLANTVIEKYEIELK